MHSSLFGLYDLRDRRLTQCHNPNHSRECEQRAADVGDNFHTSALSQPPIPLRGFCAWATQAGLMTEDVASEVGAVPTLPLVPRALPLRLFTQDQVFSRFGTLVTAISVHGVYSKYWTAMSAMSCVTL